MIGNGECPESCCVAEFRSRCEEELLLAYENCELPKHGGNSWEAESEYSTLLLCLSILPDRSAVFTRFCFNYRIAVI
jgi:hypothetical protein